MEQLTAFLGDHGYWLLAGVGFAEYGGLPIASVPLIVAAGGFSAEPGTLHPVAVAASAAAGALAADLGWYLLSRWRGEGLVGAACALSSNPGACVVGVRERLCRAGPVYLLPAKFLPGVGNLVAPAAGFAGFPLRSFLPYDLLALSLWAGAYTGLGWAFGSQVQTAVDWIVSYRRWVLGAGVVLVAGAAAWRWSRARAHGSLHEDGPAADRPAA